MFVWNNSGENCCIFLICFNFFSFFAAKINICTKKNNMKKFLLSVITLFICLFAFSQAINTNVAKSYAELWLSNAEQKSLTNLDCVYTQSSADQSQNYFYIFSSEPNNTYIIVSADERILPILGYSDESFFDPNNIPPNMKNWLDGYVDEMNYIFTMVEAEKHPDWNNIFEGNILKGAKAVAPLLDPFKWDQDCGYNFYAPPAAGPCGKAYAGCVATAMAMIMKYWNHPLHGIGERAYYYNGIIYSANFGEEYYQWDQMPYQLSSSNTANAVAKLMNHCAISVSMQWGGYATGSGAYTYEVANALKNYFGYQSQCIHKYKANNIAEWENMMKAELDMARPMEYHGNSEASGGHAFVLDGYNNNNYFHFNWGWSGAVNGYFTFSNLNPGGYNFNDNQGVVMQIEPRWDMFCNDPSNLNGTLDGTTVSLTWNQPAPGEQTLTGYEINKNGTKIATVAVTSYDDDSVGFGEYEYCIVACYDNGCKSENPVCKTMIGTFCSSPTNLQITVEETTVSLSWESPTLTDGLSKYTIYRDEEYLAETNDLAYLDEDVPYGNYSYCIYAVYGSDSPSDGICEDAVVFNSISTYNDYIKIFPNPAKNNINVEAQGITDVVVFDAFGKLIKTINRTGDALLIDLEGLATGVYILKVNTRENGTLYGKFVISD